jgi:amino acid adenylation domain-containing protein
VSAQRTAARFEQARAIDAGDRFEISLIPALVDGIIELRCVFDGNLFEATSVSRWLAAMETLLIAALASPHAPVATLPWVAEDVLAELYALQPAPTLRRQGELITDLVWAQARSTPERIAIRCNETRWTYAELVSRAEVIARQLRDLGVGTGDLIGICLGRNPAMLAAVLGVLRAGGAYVPLDPAYPRDRLEYMAEDAGLNLVLCEALTSGLLRWPQERTLAIDRLDVDALDAASGFDAGRPVSAESPAYVIYTSGSTGKPKGVSVPHRAVVNFLHSMAREPGLDAGDRLLAVTTLSFDIAVLELFLPLTKGAEIVLASREQSMDGRELAALLNRHGVTVMQATPSTWRLLVESGWEPPQRFRSLCGGEALPADLVRSLTVNDAELWNMYGPTETTVWSTCQRIDRDREISIGRPIDNTTVWILDPFLNPCPIGVPGEIWIGGTGVTLGYLNRPELTAERFIVDRFSGNSGLLYRTGDRGRWRNDRRLEHLGRLDFQVKVRGYRIELGEIESSLVAFAGVSRAVVTTREDQPGDVRIVAYLVTSSDDPLDPPALRRHLRASLPEYMIPQHFVGLASIPLLPNGKVDRKSLPPPLQERMRAANPEPARDGTERRVAEIFAQLLEADAVGIDDNFFAMGGHSLLAARLAARLGREFGVDLPMHAVFEAPDVALLSARISTLLQTAGAAAPPALAHAVRDVAPATIMQERLWIHDQLNPQSVAYNIPVAFRLGGAVDPAVLAGAFSKVVERHASLRTSLQQGPDGLVQNIRPPEPVHFEIEDLSQLGPDLREPALSRRIAELSSTPIDLGGPCTFRARLFRLSGTEWVLFFVFHHAFWDGGSTERLSLEMADLLRTARRPPALSLDYADFAVWHRRQLASKRFAAQRAERIETWRRRFEANGFPARLPTDRPREGARRTPGLADFSVPPAATDRLRLLASKHETTLYAVVLAALQIALHRFYGERHPIVSSPVRLLADPDLEPVLGMFTSMLPIAIDIPGDADFSTALEQTRRSIIDGLSSPHLQLDDILREPSLRPYAGSQVPYLAQFSFEDVRGRPRRWGDVEVRHVPLLAPEPTNDLMIWVFEHDDGLEGRVLYDASLFDETTVAELLQAYAAVLDESSSAAEHPRREPMTPDSAAAHAAAAPAIESEAGSTSGFRIASIPSRSAELAAPERMLADIWQDLLGIDDIAGEANFFDIGGHSLLAMTMIARVEKQTGVRLNLLKVANGSLRTLAMDLPSTPPASNQTLADRFRRWFGSRDKGTSS